jgi:antitoxin HicB
MKDLNYYLGLKYPVELVETDSGFVVSNPDLPGCASFGDTVPEALESLAEVRELWLRGQVEVHGVAPEPRTPEEYSGRFVIRLPKWLHRVLDSEAERQACSLNCLVVSLLSLGIGVSSGSPTEQRRQSQETGGHEWQSEWEEEASASWSIHRFLGLRRRRDDYAHVWNRVAKQRKSSASRKIKSDYGESRNVTEAKTDWPN